MSFEDFDDASMSLSSRLLPDRLRLDMTRAACLLAADRLLAGLVIDSVREFEDFADPLARTLTLPILGDEALEECLTWLVRGHALDGIDADVVREVRQHAHLVAADLPAVLLGEHGGVRTDLIGPAQQIISRLGLFWARMRIASNPSYDGQEIDDADIRSGVSMLFDQFAEVALTV